MKQFLIILILIVSKDGYAQHDCACNLKNLITVNQHLDELTDHDINLLLCTFDMKCRDNPEFTAFSNEVLFEAIQRQPELLIQELAENKDELDLQIILSELESPIHDGFDLEQILEKVSAVNEDEKIKEQVVYSLTVAIDKMKKQ